MGEKQMKSIVELVYGCSHKDIVSTITMFHHTIIYRDNVLNYGKAFKCKKCGVSIRHGDVPDLDDMFLSLLEVNKKYRAHSFLWWKVTGKEIIDSDLLVLMNNLNKKLEHSIVDWLRFSTTWTSLVIDNRIGVVEIYFSTRAGNLIGFTVSEPEWVL